MKVLLANDFHFRDKAPSSCTEAYLPELFAHGIFMREFCKQGGADAVVISGDLLDNKVPFHNSHRLIQQIIDLFKSFTVPVFVLAGNHDLQNHRFESIWETQPVGVLYRSGAVKLLAGWADTPSWKNVSYDDINGLTDPFPIYGVPWLAEWDAQDSKEKEEAIGQALAELENRSVDGPVLLVAHAPFFKPGHESPWESYSTPLFRQHIRNVYKGDISVEYGHIHDYHGLYDVGDITFANAGAVSRGSLHEANMTRPVRLTTWDSVTGLFDIFEIPHLPASEIYKLEEVAEKKREKLELSNFTSSVGNTVLEISSTESVVHHIRQMEGIEERVVNVVQELLEKVNL